MTIFKKLPFLDILVCYEKDPANKMRKGNEERQPLTLSVTLGSRQLVREGKGQVLEIGHYRRKSWIKNCCTVRWPP